MQTDRDRLIELLDGAEDLPTCQTYAGFADYLLANGVIVPICYIGQPMWYVWKHYDGSIEIIKGKISMLQQKADKSWKFRFSVNSSVWDFKIDDIRVSYFFTKEEAKKALKEREG